MKTGKVDAIVHGGQIVTASEVLEASIAIHGEKIVAIGLGEVLPSAERYIDASGKYIFPGAIDCHVHLGPDYDDWTVGPIAAAHAGLTTLIGFVRYDGQAKETLPQPIQRLKEEITRQSVLDFGFHFILNSNQLYILEECPRRSRRG
jgi:allantoinase